MVELYNDTFSTGVSRENDANEQISSFHAKALAKCHLPEDYFKRLDGAWMEYRRLLHDIPPPAKILDVGVGRGDSSVFLATQGYEVHSVEPSMDFCLLVEKAAEKFSCDITVHRLVGENLTNIVAHEFDVIFFNASLHHCDDPEKAMAEAASLLRPGGSIFLVNETILKPWDTEEKFLQRLEASPEKMGHYGGNEHAYWVSKYKRLLGMQFINIKVEPSLLVMEPVERLQMKYGQRFPDGRKVNGPVKLVALALFYILSYLACLPRPLRKTLVGTSLLQVQFSGQKTL
jgi:SAM-dependent methyltransferase